MMKKLCIYCALICIFLCGCSKNEQVISGTDSTDTTNSAQNHIKEVIVLDDAEIIIPSMLVGDEIQDVNVTVEDEISSEETTENGNDVLVISLTGNERTKIINGIADSIENSITDILNDKDRYSNIVDISPNEDCTEFTIFLSGSEVNMYESMLAVSFYTIGNKYQIYSGVPEEEALTKVKYVNQATGEIIVEADSSSLNTN